MTALLIAAAAPSSARADGRELRRIEGEIGILGVNLKAFVNNFSGEQEITRLRPFSERMTDGEILFLLGDYTRASLVLYDLVSDRHNQQEPLYGKAVYDLAESLFQIGHDISAREYFGRLVERRDASHLEDAIRRLIQIADRNRRWEGLDANLAVLEKRGPLPPDIAYIRAKSLLRQGKPSEAIEAAAAVPRDHPLALKAAYIAAVAQLEKGDVDGSRAAFAGLSKGAGDGFDDAAYVRNLAAMNAGRILLEQGKLGESIDAYQAVPRSSPMFEEALYEVTWTFVRAAGAATTEEQRRAEYDKARNALEILLLLEAENPVAPEARLLLGNILLRLGRYKEATDTFSEVVRRYEPVRDAIRELAERKLDPDAYFQEVSSGGHGRKGLLPPLALHWAAEQGELRVALELISSLDESEASLDEAGRLADKLLGILESEHRVSFFPGLREVQARALEYDNTITALSQRLLAVERKLAYSGLTPDARASLQAVLAERAKLEPEYLKLPKRKEDYEERLAGTQRRVRDLEQQAYGLRYQIGSIQAQLNALRVWIVQHRDGMSEEAHDEYAERIGQLDGVAAELDKMQRDVAERIAREKSQLSITTAEQGHDAQIRARYADLLVQERDILATAGKAAGERGEQLAQVERQRDILAGYRVELERLGNGLDEQVRRKSADVKAALLKEQGTIAVFRERMEAQRREARRVIGRVAEMSLDRVRQRFHDIVLRADVGIVDVAWARKEEQTGEISRRVDERRRELQALDRELAEIVGED